jgi:O-antigen/teichoic acid export membrane protein
MTNRLTPLVTGASTVRSAGVKRGAARPDTDGHGQIRSSVLQGADAYRVAYLTHGLTIMQGGLLAVVLGPSGFGLWALIKLMLTYLSQAGRTALFALGLRAAEAISAVQQRRVSGVLQAVVRMDVLAGIALIACCSIGAIELIRSRPHLPAWAWPVIISLWVAQRAYHLLLVRAKHQANRQLQAKLIGALLASIALPVGAWIHGLAGAFAGLLVAYAIALIWLVRGRAGQPKSPQTARRIRPTDTPAWLAWVPAAILHDTDVWLVTGFFGINALGLYGVGVFLGSIVRLWPHVFRSSYLPYVKQEFGATPRWDRAQPVIEQPLLFIAYAMPVLIGALFCLTDPLVRLVLPAFTGGLAAAKFYLLGTAWAAAASITYNFCIDAALRRRWFWQTFWIVVAHVALTSSLIRLGYGLVGGAAGMSVTYAVYTLLQLRLILSSVKAPDGAWVGLFGRLAVPWLVSVTLLVALDTWWILPADPAGLLLASIGRLGVATGVLVWQFMWAERRWGLSGVLRHSRSPGQADAEAEEGIGDAAIS